MDREEMTLEEVIETLQVWISTADDEYDREEHGRVCGLKEALHEIKKIKPCEDAISRKQALDAFGLSEKTRKYGGDHSGYNTMMLYEIQDVIEGLPSVNPQANNEDIHREREQAYMKGYEDASKRYRTEPCEDAISIDNVIEWLKNKDIIKLSTQEEVARKELRELSSVNVKEKTGWWEWNQYDYNPNLGNWHCSECGSIAIECVPKKDPSGVPLYKYCPYCGSRNEVKE